jgi:phosphomannomutase
LSVVWIEDNGFDLYSEKGNPAASPAGTISSIEHALRSLDRKAEEEQREIERQEKALADYKAQMGKPFEHEARLKELLAKQAQLNAALDLDKHDSQMVAETEGEKAVPTSFAAKVTAENRAAEMAP